MNKYLVNNKSPNKIHTYNKMSNNTFDHYKGEESDFTFEHDKGRKPLHQEFILKNLKPIECNNRSIFNCKDFTVDFDESWMLISNPARNGSCNYVSLKSAQIVKTETSTTEYPIILSKKAIFTFSSIRYIPQHINSLKQEFSRCNMENFFKIEQEGNVVTIMTTDKGLKENDMYLLSFEFRDRFLGVVIGAFFCKKNSNPDPNPRTVYYKYRPLPTIAF